MDRERIGASKVSACFKLEVLTLITSVSHGKILLHNPDFIKLKVKNLTSILNFFPNPKGRRKIVTVINGSFKQIIGFLTDVVK